MEEEEEEEDKELPVLNDLFATVVPAALGLVVARYPVPRCLGIIMATAALAPAGKEEEREEEEGPGPYLVNLREWPSPTKKVSSTSEPAWCVAARGMGTYRRRVVMPRATCTPTMPTAACRAFLVKEGRAW